MDAVQRANARLRELGYAPEEASVDHNGSPARLHLSGSLLNDSTDDAEVMLAVLRMLPPKAHLLAFRYLLGLDDGGSARART